MRKVHVELMLKGQGKSQNLEIFESEKSIKVTESANEEIMETLVMNISSSTLTDQLSKLRLLLITHLKTSI